MVRMPSFVWMCAGIAATLVALSVPDATVVAQTPTAELDVPAPEECLVEPREFPFFPEGVGQRAAATPTPLQTEPEPPFAMPAGEPADAETVAAVTATVREAIACRNGNAFLSAYALFTQDMIVALFGGPATIDPEIRATVVEEIGPVPRRQRIGLVAIEDVVALPDGRVGAIVTTGNTRRAFQDYLVFELGPESGRWLIDESVALSTQERPQREAVAASPEA